jgi:TolA-binding protein
MAADLYTDRCSEMPLGTVTRHSLVPRLRPVSWNQDLSIGPMKKFAIALAILVLLAGIASYNVWHALNDPVTSPPTAVEIGRQQLHAQLQQSESREAEIEKQDWDSVTLLRDLIQAHQHRIEQLSGNTQAAEIVAHDQDAIARIEKRISDLIAQRAVQPHSTDESKPSEGPANSTPAEKPKSLAPRP